MENNNQTQNDNKAVNDSRQKQNRFKSKAAWVAAAALLLFINYFLENIDMIEDVKDKNKLYRTILDSVIWRKVDTSKQK